MNSAAETASISLRRRPSVNRWLRAVAKQRVRPRRPVRNYFQRQGSRDDEKLRQPRAAANLRRGLPPNRGNWSGVEFRRRRAELRVNPAQRGGARAPLYERRAIE